MSKQNAWLTPAQKRHGWHVIAAAVAVVGLYAWRDDPDLILIGATAVAVSGIAAGAIEGIRALIRRWNE
jgi:hypothetical protein